MKLARAIGTSEMVTQNLVEVQIHPGLAKHIVGERGCNINTLKNKTNCEIQIVGNSKFKVSICGMAWNMKEEEINKIARRHTINERSRSRSTDPYERRERDKSLDRRETHQRRDTRRYDNIPRERQDRYNRYH